MIRRMPAEPRRPAVAGTAPSPVRAAAFLIGCALVGLAAGFALWRVLPHDGPSGAERAPAPLAVAAATDAPGTAPPPGDALGGPPGDGLDAAATGPAAPRMSYHDGIVRAMPSVVSVYARAPGADGATGVSGATGASAPDAASGDGAGSASGAPPGDTSQGSGVVVGADGTILTNLHIVDGASRIGVQLSDGSLHVGTLVGTDPETDLAVLRVDAGPLPALALGDAPPLRVGDVVLAIGNPFGVGQTVTQGIVSATRRRVAGGSAWQDFVQIDAAINPGSSGGALIDPLGRLVGVTSAVLQREGGAQGIGFAIPAELLARVVPRIVSEGRVVRGWLGIGADDLAMFPDLARAGASGAVITDVLPGSPAAIAGLERRDVVTAVDGRPVGDATALLLSVSALAPGSDVALRIERGGEPRRIGVVLGERPGVPRPPERPPGLSPADPGSGDGPGAATGG